MSGHPDPAANAFRGDTRAAGFIHLNVSQFLGAFNDKAFMTLISLHLVASFLDKGGGQFYVMLSTALFILPFVLFSNWCGVLADRSSKRDVMLRLKVVEGALMLLGALAFLLDDIRFVFAILFLMGAQSTLFSPAKYGILPELLAPEHLSHGNGLVELVTFASIILGTVFASLVFPHLTGRLWIVPLLFVVTAWLGHRSAARVPPVPPARPAAQLRLNFLAAVWSDTRVLLPDRALALTIAATAYFWFLATMVQNNLFTFAKETMRADETTVGLLLVSLALGIGLGSAAAGRLSGEIVEFGLVPLGALGMTVFVFDLSLAATQTWRVAVDLFALGFAGGLFIVPLHAYMQECAPDGETGRVIGVANFYQNVAIIIAALLVMALQERAGLTPSEVYRVIAAMTLASTALIVCLLPDFLVRLVLFLLTRTVYRITLRGDGRLPRTGAALLVANHASLSDAFVLQATTHRPIRFLLARRFVERGLRGVLFRLMGGVALPEGDPDAPPPDAARDALLRGELVCLFPEGEITPDGTLGPFRDGYARLAASAAVPVIPLAVHGMWGSIWSRAHGDPGVRPPRRLPYPVTIAVSPPLPPERCGEARDRIVALLSGFANHPEGGSAA